MEKTRFRDGRRPPNPRSWDLPTLNDGEFREGHNGKVQTRLG